RGADRRDARAPPNALASPGGEGGERLAGIRLVEEAYAVMGLAVHGRREQAAEALVQHRLRRGQRGARAAREDLAPVVDPGVELFGRDHLRCEAVLARPGGVALLAAQEQLTSGGLAEHLR